MRTNACRILDLHRPRGAEKGKYISTSTSKDYAVYPANVNFAIGEKVWLGLTNLLSRTKTGDPRNRREGRSNVLHINDLNVVSAKQPEWPIRLLRAVR